MSKRHLVERWFTAIWENNNAAVLAELLHPSVRESNTLDGMPNPHDDFPVLVEAVHRLIGRFSVDILHHMEDGDWTSTFFVLRSDVHGSEQSVSADGIVMMRFIDNQIAELRSRFDAFTFFEQLGQLPEEAMPACLAGQRLTWA